jgi:hypothetical protein
MKELTGAFKKSRGREPGRVDNDKIFQSKINNQTRHPKIKQKIKKVNSPILTGYQIFHNYIHVHEGLKGKTPAEVAGIKIEGGNKWITVIQNATKFSH